jgi:hypothetical protein
MSYDQNDDWKLNSWLIHSSFNDADSTSLIIELINFSFSLHKYRETQGHVPVHVYYMAFIQATFSHWSDSFPSAQGQSHSVYI